MPLGKYAKKRISAGLNIHLFSSHAEIGIDDDRFLGTEGDLYFSYKVSPPFAIQAGYSQLFATDSMEKLKGGDKGEIQNWAYVMLTFKPQFYKKE